MLVNLLWGYLLLTRDLLITLELYRMNEGYTIAGELLADENSFSVYRYGSFRWSL